MFCAHWMLTLSSKWRFVSDDWFILLCYKTDCSLRNANHDCHFCHRVCSGPDAGTLVCLCIYYFAFIFALNIRFFGYLWIRQSLCLSSLKCCDLAICFDFYWGLCIFVFIYESFFIELHWYLCFEHKVFGLSHAVCAFFLSEMLWSCRMFWFLLSIVYFYVHLYMNHFSLICIDI